MPAGLFITLEGGEGSGKSTQARLLADALKSKGHDVILTREPGGTPQAETIRNLLVRPEGGAWTPMAECLLIFAARQMHVETLIKPALKVGKIVICDRFTDSTRAYQGYGHGVPIKDVEQLNFVGLAGFEPDLTLILDIDPEEGLKRAGSRKNEGEDKFERLGLEFHKKLHSGFKEIARAFPKRCVMIDASKSQTDVAAQILKAVETKLK